MSLIILTGASGAGKTSIVQTLAESGDILCFHFDSVGVPSSDEMIAVYGSGEQWQRATTIDWLRKIEVECHPSQKVLFEGQTRIAFIQEALALHPIKKVSILLVDCDDITRKQRLTISRNQPELANEQMMNWAAYLRQEASAAKIQLLDTSLLSIDEAASIVRDTF